MNENMAACLFYITVTVVIGVCYCFKQWRMKR